MKIDAFVPPSNFNSTSHYLSVERMLETGLDSNPLASDMFSLGLIILEIVLEENIFDGLKSASQQIELLLSIFGHSIIAPFEKQLKSVGFWPSQQSISKHSKSSLGQFIYKRSPKYLFLIR